MPEFELDVFSAGQSSERLSGTEKDGRRACLFVLSPRGPRGWPFVMRRLGNELWTTTYTSSAKVPVLEAATRATCILFDDEDSAYPYEVVSGPLRVDPPDDVTLRQWFGPVATPVGRETSRLEARLRSGKRVFIRVRIDQAMNFGDD